MIMSLAMERRNLPLQGSRDEVVLEADSTDNDVFDTELHSSGPQKQLEINVDPWNPRETAPFTEVTDSIPSKPLNGRRAYPRSPNKESESLIYQQYSPIKDSSCISWKEQERVLDQTYHNVNEQENLDPWGLQAKTGTTPASMGSLLDLSIEEKVRD